MSTVFCVDDNGVTGTAQYVVSCDKTKACAIIDPVWNYDAPSGKTSTDHVDALSKYIEEKGLKVEWILETHVHADHLTGADLLRKKYPQAKYGIGAGIVKVQQTFWPMFNVDGAQEKSDGSQFDKLFSDGEDFTVGELKMTCIATPGHTADSSSYVLQGKGVFIGDTMFQPDKGSARCDFPNGDAATLYKSIQRLLSYPDDYKLYCCHDYPGDKREFRYETTVKQQREENIHLAGGKSLEDYSAMRKARDETLKVPHLLLPSVQVNMRGGKLPPAESNGTHYIKIPVNKL